MLQNVGIKGAKVVGEKYISLKGSNYRIQAAAATIH